MQLRCCSTTVFLFKALTTTAIIGVSKRSSLVVLPTATAFGVVSSSSSSLSFMNPTSSLTTTQTATRLFSSSSNSMSTTTPDVSRFMTDERPSETKEYIMQQTMYRVKDPIKSLEFYCDVLGFTLIMYKEFPQWEFNVYFVAQTEPKDIPDDEEGRWKYCMQMPGCLELTYNYGSEQETGLVYNTGNADTTGIIVATPNSATTEHNTTHTSTTTTKSKGGFGHIGITTPDVYKACERFKRLGCTFTKTPNSGGMKGLAFIKDPDGYLIEILPQGAMVTQPYDCDGISADGNTVYKDNSK